jgi:hypothetical protein
MRFFGRFLQVALLVLVTACEAAPQETGQPVGRVDKAHQYAHLYKVAGPALSALRPDYKVNFDDYLATRYRTAPPDVARIEVYKVPMYGYAGFSAIKVDLSPGRRQNLNQLLDSGDATSALRAYADGSGRGAKAKEVVIDVLKGLNDKLFGVAIILEFKSPITQSEVEDLGVDGKVLFNVRWQNGLPVAWDIDNCQLLEKTICSTPGPKDQLYRWLKSLSSQDRDFLKMDGIELEKLESAALNGEITGILVDWVNPRGALTLIRDQNVKAAYLIGVMQDRLIPTGAP